MDGNRFIVEYGENNLPFFADLEEHRDMSIKEVVELLNEQDKKIRELEKEQQKRERGWHSAKEYLEKLKEGDERQQ